MLSAALCTGLRTCTKWEKPACRDGNSAGAAHEPAVGGDAIRIMGDEAAKSDLLERGSLGVATRVPCSRRCRCGR